MVLQFSSSSYVEAPSRENFLTAEKTGSAVPRPSEDPQAFPCSATMFTGKRMAWERAARELAAPLGDLFTAISLEQV